MAVSTALAARILIRMATAKSENKTLKNILIVIASCITAVVLLLSMILSILSAPEDLDGSLGDFKEQYGYLVEDVPSVGNDVDSFINADIQTATAEITDGNRKAIIQTAMTLVGKVSYFWGGKSANGWNHEWGKSKKVTAAGSSSSGKMKPYGLDCSGYVDWVLRTSGVWTKWDSPSPYGSTGGLWGVTSSISVGSLQPGDLGFLQKPGSSGINHVGIFYGYNDKGKKLWLHCSSSGGGVVLNTFSGFQYYRRLSEVGS